MDCPCREVREERTIWIAPYPSPGSVEIPVAITRPIEEWLWACSDDPCEVSCYDECPDCETVLQYVYATDQPVQGARPFTVVLKRMVCREDLQPVETTCRDVVDALMRSPLLKRR